MSRDDGFAVMDVSTDVVNDPKVRKLWRHAPDHAGTAFAAYMATIGESWKSGRRVSIDDAWPPHVPFSKPAVEALVHVGLIDKSGHVPPKAWRGWFGKAKQRRATSRERWQRANENRRADAARLPRGSNAVTASTVPSVPSVPTVRVNKDVERPETARARGPVLVHPERAS